MASNNGRLSHRMGGSKPSCLLLTLCIVIGILLYSYWSLSSTNGLLIRDVTVLRSRFKSLTLSKLKLETEKKQLSAELLRLHEAHNDLKQTVDDQKKKEAAADMRSKKFQLDLKAKNEMLEKMQKEEVQNRKELQSFKENINSTSVKFKVLNERTSNVLKLYKQLKAKNSELQKKNKILEAQVNKYKSSVKLRGTHSQTGKPNVDQTLVVTPPSSKAKHTKKEEQNEKEEDVKPNNAVKVVNPVRNITAFRPNNTEQVPKNVSKSSSNETSPSNQKTNESISDHTRSENKPRPSRVRELGNISNPTGDLTTTKLTTTEVFDKSKEMERNANEPRQNIESSAGSRQRPKSLQRTKRKKSSKGEAGDSSENQILPHRTGRIGVLRQLRDRERSDEQLDSNRPESDEEHEPEDGQ